MHFKQINLFFTLIRKYGYFNIFVLALIALFLICFLNSIIDQAYHKNIIIQKENIQNIKNIYQTINPENTKFKPIKNYRSIYKYTQTGKFFW